MKKQRALTPVQLATMRDLAKPLGMGGAPAEAQRKAVLTRIHKPKGA